MTINPGFTLTTFNISYLQIKTTIIPYFKNMSAPSTPAKIIAQLTRETQYNTSKTADHMKDLEKHLDKRKLPQSNF